MPIMMYLVHLPSDSFFCAIDDIYIENVLGGKINILGGHSSGHSKKYIYICSCVEVRGSVVG
jgi:hypothetical protein